jgi:hypothetical protein
MSQFSRVLESCRREFKFFFSCVSSQNGLKKLSSCPVLLGGVCVCVVTVNVCVCVFFFPLLPQDLFGCYSFF